MIGILIAKFKLFLRKPWIFVAMTIMSIGFALTIGQANQGNKLHVPVYAENESVKEEIGKKIEEANVFSVKWMTEAEMMEKIENGKAETGVKLYQDQFQVIVGLDSHNIEMIKQTVQGVYAKKYKKEQVVQVLSNGSNGTNGSEKEYGTFMSNPIFSIDTNNFRGKDTFVYNQTLHSLFGFTLFFVIYTIANNVLPIVIEKNDGVWDRMILSPVRKWEMYIGNLIYSFVTGYIQVLVIFFIFRYIIGVDFNGQFVKTCLLLIPYILSIVALSILISAFVKNSQQYNAILPVLAVSMAMIGGAYWPLELVESDVLIALSKINPITYGMEILNGIVVYGYPLEELLLPISILLLMAVIMTGIGIHFMEKRHV